MIHVFIKRLILTRKFIFFHDSLWVPITLLIAYWISPASNMSSSLPLLFFLFPIQVIAFYYFDLSQGVWRFFSLPDLVRIVKAVLLGTLVFTLISVLHSRLAGLPRSVLLLYPLFLISGLSFPRLCYRYYKDYLGFRPSGEGKKTLIVGAGQAGELLLRDLIRLKEYNLVAIVDDDPLKQKRDIHGIKVAGKLADIPIIVKLLDIELVILAIPSAPRKVFVELVKGCSGTKVECKTLPFLDQLDQKEVDLTMLRSLCLDDLLGREPVELDLDAIASYITNNSILVTGGGGSIGSELCRQIALQGPERLIIFDHSEYNLYLIDNELQANFPELKIDSILGDIKNVDRVDWLFRSCRPKVVFHAAAYKHVPMLEYNPAEGVNNNVFGTINVAEAAVKYKSNIFVFVSTDKAVYPANVMGATKRIAEIYCQNLASRSVTKFITTRFGNVLGSTGSVVPLFEKQIAMGGPVTVTHPEITRFFMTIPEAVSLILQAGSMGMGGEIFVLDMGEPILINELAKQMILFHGLEPDLDVQIVYTGLRPGEKLFEQVLHEDESLTHTTHQKLLLAEGRRVEWDWLIAELEMLRKVADNREIKPLIARLRRIIPEYIGFHLSDNFVVEQESFAQSTHCASELFKFPEREKRYKLITKIICYDSLHDVKIYGMTLNISSTGFMAKFSKKCFLESHVQVEFKLPILDGSKVIIVQARNHWISCSDKNCFHGFSFIDLSENALNFIQNYVHSKCKNKEAPSS